MEGTVRRRLTVKEQIHEAAVSATVNVPHRARGRATKLAHALEVFENLPDYLRDNEFIHGSYRRQQSMSSSLMTIFKIHNETGNVWTHLGGFLLFLGLAFYFITHPPTPLAVPKEHIEDVWHSVQHRFHDLGGSIDQALLQPLGDNINALSARVSDNVHAIEDAIHSQLSHGVHALSGGVQALSDGVSHALSDQIHALSDGVHALSDNLQHISQGVSNNLQGVGHKVQHFLNDQIQARLKAVVQWPSPRWPVYVYFAGACVCLLTSCVCHLLGCCEKHISQMVWRFDYAGIAVLIVASFFPAVYYAFLCQPFWRNFYLWTTCTFGVAAICMSLPEMFQAPQYRTLRALLFVCLGGWGVVPVAHQWLFYWDTYAIRTAFTLDLCMGATYLIGAVIFAMRIPERWIPGKVDIIGHSHQLWHLAVVIAAYIHYQAVLVLLEWRDASGGCAAPGLVNGPVARVFEELQQKGAEVVGIDQVIQQLGLQLQQMQATAVAAR